MPRLNLDLSEAAEFAPVPAGSYAAAVDQFSDVKMSSNNNQYIGTAFKVTDGDHEGKLVWRNFMLEGAGAGFFRDFWQKATGEELPKEADIDVDTDDAIGAEVQIVVEEREYPEGSGEMQPEIKKILTAK